jgi:hypothetical protein
VYYNNKAEIEKLLKEKKKAKKEKKEKKEKKKSEKTKGKSKETKKRQKLIKDKAKHIAEIKENILPKINTEEKLDVEKEEVLATNESFGPPLNEKTDFLYGIMTSTPSMLRLQVESRLTGAVAASGRYQQPAFVIFERDTKDRAALRATLRELQSEFPQAHFEYVGLGSGPAARAIEQDPEAFMKESLTSKKLSAKIPAEVGTFTQVIG